MSSLTSHKIWRDAEAPWWELRVSTNSSDCYRPHTHDEYSLGIVDAGSATFRHGADESRSVMGTVVMIEPHVVHSCNPVALQRWSYRMLFIRADWLHAAMADYWGLPEPVPGLEFLASRVDDPMVTKAVDQLCTATPGTSSHLSAELPRFLAGWARPKVEGAGLQLAGALAPAEAILQSETGIDMTVGALAEVCGMTPTRFIREFRKRYAMTPGEYLQDKRVNGARRLIAMGVPISEAALDMGFADQAHLQRTFKARHAMTPGRYRSGA
jgi:AraC-like DNA-binding protein